MATSRRAVSEKTALHLLLSVSFIDALGRGLFLACATLFYSQVLKLSNLEIGTGLALSGVCGLLSSLVIGKVADRFGVKFTLSLLQFWRGAGFVLFLFVSDYTQFLLVSAFIGLVEQSIWPLLQSITGKVTRGASFVASMSKIAVVRNVAYTLSAGLVALVVMMQNSGFAIKSLIFGTSLIYLAVGLIFLLITLPIEDGEKVANDASSAVKNKFSFKDSNFMALSFCNGILSLHAVAMTIILPLWIIKNTHLPESLVGILLAFNTVLTILFQMRFSRNGDDIRHASSKQRLAGMSLFLFCTSVTLSSGLSVFWSVVLLAFATIVLTAGELWQAAGAWGISHTLSPESDKSLYLSAYAMGTTFMMVIGPGLLPALVVDNGVYGWLAFGMVFLLAGAVIPALTARAYKQLNPAVETVSIE